MKACFDMHGKAFLSEARDMLKNFEEDISVSGTSDSCGNRRHFTARVVAHYIDFNSATAGL